MTLHLLGKGWSRYYFLRVGTLNGWVMISQVLIHIISGD